MVIHNVYLNKNNVFNKECKVCIKITNVHINISNVLVLH